MSAEDWIDDFFEADDFWGFDPNLRVKRTDIVCNSCNTGGFRWGKVDGRWRLFDKNGKLHACCVR